MKIKCIDWNENHVTICNTSVDTKKVEHGKGSTSTKYK